MLFGFFKEKRLDKSITIKILFRDSNFVLSAPQQNCSIFNRVFEPTGRLWSSSIETGIDPSNLFKNLTDSVTLEIDEGLINKWGNTISSQNSNFLNKNDCCITIEKRQRYYQNNEGIKQDLVTTWCSITLAQKNLEHIETVTDGISCIEGVNQIIESCLNELNKRSDLIFAQKGKSQLFKKENLVLSPTVAAVLFHELIGHGSEEIDLWTSSFPLVGPKYMQILSKHPNQNGFDDEGVPISEVQLVNNGYMVKFPIDREQVSKNGGYPSGLCQAATHGRSPRVRCTHLKVFGGQTDPEYLIANVNKGIFCFATSGAEFHQGFTVVRVKGARRIENGELGTVVSPFIFIINLPELQYHLTELANDSRIGRSAHCVKYGEAIPTQTQAPSTLLTDIPVFIQ